MNRSGPSTGSSVCVLPNCVFFHFLKLSGNLSAVVEAKRFGFGLVTDLMEGQKRGFFSNSVSWLGPKHVRVLDL